MARDWEARSQHCGMPISFTKYYIDEGIIYREKGLFNTELEQVRLYRVIDLSLRKNLIDKMFRQGTIIINSKDKTLPILELKRIPNPEEVLKMLNKMTENERRKSGIRTREIITDDESDEYFNDYDRER